MRRFALVLSRFALRTVTVVLAFSGLVALSGCWVSSINPLYEDSLFSRADPDLILDQNLVGAWGVGDEDCPGTLKIEAKEREYDLTMTPSPQCKREEKTSRYQGHLVKLDDHVFLDLGPEPDDVCEMCFPQHWIFLARIEKDSLSLTPINDEWLKQAVQNKTVSIQTLPDNPEILAGSSKELKSFARKYANDKSVFKPVEGFTFKRQ